MIYLLVMGQNRPRQKRALGRGYRAQIRELAALGLSRAQILDAMPGLRASELQITLAVSSRRGRPPKPPTIASIEAVKRWRSTQRPRTMRAALECIDFLLKQLEATPQQGTNPEQKLRGRTLPGFS